MQISSLVEPLIPLPQSSDSNADNDSYASSVISSLKKQLEIERAAHQRTRLDAATQISDLQARLARREAALEESIGKKGGSKEILPVGRIVPLDKEEAMKLLHAKNKAVELEVKELGNRLERARLSGPTSDQPDLRGGPHATDRSALPTVNPGTEMIQSLDLQIQELGRQIDGFTRQRQELSQYINDEKFLMEPNVAATDVASLYQAAMLRENALKEENKRLQRLVDENQHHNVPTCELLEPQDGEISMDLSSPIFPTAILECSDGPLAQSTPIANTSPLLVTL